MLGQREFWARQGLFWPSYASFSIGSGQQRGQTGIKDAQGLAILGAARSLSA